MGLHPTKKFLRSKGNNQQNKKNLLNGRKYLLMIYLIRGSYSKYIRNSYKITPKTEQKAKSNNPIKKMERRIFKAEFLAIIYPC